MTLSNYMGTYWHSLSRVSQDTFLDDVGLLSELFWTKGEKAPLISPATAPPFSDFIAKKRILLAIELLHPSQPTVLLKFGTRFLASRRVEQTHRGDFCRSDWIESPSKIICKTLYGSSAKDSDIGFLPFCRDSHTHDGLCRLLHMSPELIFPKQNRTRFSHTILMRCRLSPSQKKRAAICLFSVKSLRILKIISC